MKPSINAFPVIAAVVILSCSFERAFAQSIEVAYQIDEGVFGNQDFGGPLGLDFVVNTRIQILDLGAFDSESDGLLLPIIVELWSRDDAETPDDFADDVGLEIIASREFPDEDSGELDGGSRFLSLEVPVTLAPGSYTIVGWGYGPEEMNYNLSGRFGEDEGLFTSDLDLISFVGSSRFGAAGTGGDFPASIDGGPENRYGAGTFRFTTYVDTDSDGIPDAAETALDLNPNDPADAALDRDGDGLTNKAEYELRTDLDKVDTDGDTLNDNVETNTGVWVSVDDRGTSPLKTDSDEDGLADGIESNTGTFVDATNPGTSPVDADSDGDGFDDNREIMAGTNPVDDHSPGVVPPPSGGIAILVESERAGNQSFGGALGIDFIVNRPIRVLSLGAFDHESDGFNAEITVELWTRDDGETPDDFTDDFGEDILVSTVFSEEAPGDILQGFQFRDLDSSLVLEPGNYTIVGWGYNDDERNGNDGNAGNFPTELTESDAIEFVGTSRFGDAGAGGDFPGTLDGGPEVRYGAGSFTFDEGSDRLFTITEIIYDGAERTVSLEWNSSPGATYAVAFSTDFIEWIELEDGLESQGESTTFAEEGIPEDAPFRYYRVRKE